MEGRDMENMNFQGKQPRRRFLGSLLAGIAGGAALLFAPRRAGAETKNPTVPETGPILYRRTEEAERYYRTLYL